MKLTAEMVEEIATDASDYDMWVARKSDGEPVYQMEPPVVRALCSAALRGLAIDGVIVPEDLLRAAIDFIDHSRGPTCCEVSGRLMSLLAAQPPVEPRSQPARESP